MLWNKNEISGTPLGIKSCGAKWHQNLLPTVTAWCRRILAFRPPLTIAQFIDKSSLFILLLNVIPHAGL
jgi:hypothetical protein